MSDLVSSPAAAAVDRRWAVHVDTGGTFTDCVAVDPSGRRHRVKVLSSSALRGRVAHLPAATTVQLEPGSWPAVPELLRGCRCHLLERPGAGVEVLAYQPPAAPGAGPVLELAAPLAGLLAGVRCEVRSPEEAPVLAARLVTGTPGGQPLPPLALRLATTHGTNALLERHGARTALCITRGFGDLLRIGNQQRPELFALHVVKPEPLYERVLEVPERLAADGSVLLPLQPEALAAAVAELVAAGVESAAVVLLHSYRNPGHEQQLAELLRRAGVGYVSCSAQLAPLIGFLPRAETAVVDAYLAPLIDRYLQRVAGALGPGSTVHVMTSAGGLAEAAAYPPKDSLLSGPAGGVVGAARAGRQAGYPRVIAFDMGGTSTDVARVDGDFEYQFEHQVGDARLVAPALAIESVAAGGGSICRFEDRHLKVGPESAGADPGPACYGAGGPLTLTDANLLLGRLDGDRFEIPIDVAAAQRARDEVATAMAAGNVPVPPAESLLEGFLDIANERMADAIRTISVRRGYDPGSYALVAFGGAGGQHACAVARLLGIGTVLVPPDAGLLSAVGLEVGVLERFAERQVLQPLPAVAAQVDAWLDELAARAVAAVCAEGAEPQEVVVRRRLVHLRFLGQDTPLALEPQPGDDLAAVFATAYRELYGYQPEGRTIELESLRVVASTRPQPEPPPALVAIPRQATPEGHRPACFGAVWREVPFYLRQHFHPGDRCTGPALVFEQHSATVVEQGWQATLDGSETLVLEHVERLD